MPAVSYPSGIVVGEDGVSRCGWAGGAAMRDYHDSEWGIPVYSEVGVFERICLEGFQAGLSWSTILNKREAFRAAFAAFDPDLVAAFDDGDVERLLGDAGIVRHRGKITAAIANARAVVELRSQATSVTAVVWAAEPAPAPERLTMADLPATTPESQALSAELRRLGFRFVGPTTVYAAMQAIGVVNDHLAGCWARPVVEAARALPRPAQALPRPADVTPAP